MENSRLLFISLHYATCRGKEKQRETEEDLDGQCQGRPEREKYRLDQDW